MKKLFFTICFTVLVFNLFLAYSWDKKNVRTEKIEVYGVSSNELSVIDKQGNIFSCWIDSTKNLECGKTIKATFLTKGTKDVKDDSFVRFSL